MQEQFIKMSNGGESSGISGGDKLFQEAVMAEFRKLSRRMDDLEIQVQENLGFALKITQELKGISLSILGDDYLMMKIKMRSFPGEHKMVMLIPSRCQFLHSKAGMTWRLIWSGKGR